MRNWVHGSVASFTINTVIALTMVLFSFGVNATHDPIAFPSVETERHIALASEAGDLGHIHDDDMLDETTGKHIPGHLHGHNPLDHSHETPAYVSQQSLIFTGGGGAWNAKPPLSPDLELSFSIDRPPRA